MKRKIDSLLRNKILKIVMAVLLFIFSALTILSGCFAAYMISENVYFTDKEKYRNQLYYNHAMNIANIALNEWQNGTTDADESSWPYLFKDTNVTGIRLETTDHKRAEWGGNENDTIYRFFFEYASSGKTNKGKITFCAPIYYNDDLDAEQLPSVEEMKSNFGIMNDVATINVYVSKVFHEKDAFYWNDLFTEIIYGMKYFIYLLILIFFSASIYCFVFLMRSAGLKKGEEKLHPWFCTKIPVDLWYGVWILVFYLIIQFIYEAFCYRGNRIILILGIPTLFALFLFLCMDASIRYKIGGFWKHSLLYWIGIRIVKWMKKMAVFAKELVVELPIIWKSVIFYLCVCGINFILLIYNYGELDNLLIIWGIESILLFLLVFATTIMMRKLLKAGKSLAEGDMTTQVDCSKMLLDFKKHGEDLNHIGEGIALAVEERMNSERMKTALITNVSHDLKTPLTSIINYSDLIGHENTENEQIKEYAQVLHRQSEKLKHLLEDLVEVSKASTGNIEIKLEACEVGVILTQVVGEYEEKLSQAKLELITKKPENPIYIMADSRRLWRIFDNLIINICKYAQDGTRVFLSLEEEQDDVKISFKNISKAILDITPEELMERFVRGDQSRNSEGNGLGLAITKSLTELQGGTMEIVIDGDLFKVVLRFPKKS